MINQTIIARLVITKSKLKDGALHFNLKMLLFD